MILICWSSCWPLYSAQTGLGLHCALVGILQTSNSSRLLWTKKEGGKFAKLEKVHVIRDVITKYKGVGTAYKRKHLLELFECLISIAYVYSAEQ